VRQRERRAWRLRVRQAAAARMSRVEPPAGGSDR